MKLIRLPLVLCLALIAHVLHAKETHFDLGKDGDLFLNVPAAWRAESKLSANPPGYELQFTPQNGANAAAKLIVFALTEPLPIERANIDRVFTRTCDVFLDHTVEKKVSIKRFKSAQGQGVYSVFTDPKLVGQPPKPQDYKFMVAGLIHPVESHQVVVNLFTDDLASAEAAVMNTLVESIRLTPPVKN